MFSIIMPVWNRAEMVGEAIESVLAQTRRDFELIIVDDGSEDHIAEVVQPHLCDQVQFHRHAHRGHSAARNLGIEHSRGEWIAYLDSDNTWRPSFLEVMGAALETAPRRHHVAYCIANRLTRDASSGAWISVAQIGGPFDYRRLRRGSYIDLNTLVHSRRAVELEGVFDETLPCYVDWDLLLRITARYDPLFVLETLVDYKTHSTPHAVGLMADKTGQGMEVRRRIRQRYRLSFERVTKVHDTNVFEWDHLPLDKIRNYRSWRTVRYDTDQWRAACMPHMLQIEPTSLCNLACPLCPAGRNELNRARRHMTLPEFQGIIDDMERWLMFIIMWDWGEPCMNPALPGMLRYAADRDIRTVTSTNAHFLQDEGYVEALLTSGLTTLIVAVDSLCAENYSIYRQRGDVNRVLAALERVVAMKRRLGSPTSINMRTVVMRQNEHEIPELRKLAREAGVDRYTVKTLNPHCGLPGMAEQLLPRSPNYRRYAYPAGSFEPVRRRVDCSRIWWMCNVLSNGDVIPCTYDYDAKLKVGNAFERPLSELWNGEAFCDLRRRIHTEPDAQAHCCECDIHYQRSRSGWFPESTDFTATPGKRLCEAWERVKKDYVPRRFWKPR